MRIPPIDHQQWTDEVREVLASFSVPFSQYGLNGDESEKDRLSPILSTVLQNPKLASVYFPLAHYLLRDSSLEPRHTRLVILRVATLWQFELERKQHAMMAVRDKFFNEAEVDALVKIDPGNHNWTELEQLLIKAVAEIHAHSNISDDTWDQLGTLLSREQLVDLTFTIGGYVLAGMYMNVFKIPV
jgi:4-carboxymuconolactone decarboxylase